MDNESSPNRQPEHTIPLTEVEIGDTFYTYSLIDTPDRPKPVYQKVPAMERNNLTRQYDAGVVYRLVGFLMPNGNVQKETPIAGWNPPLVIPHYRDNTSVVIVNRAMTTGIIDLIEQEATADLKNKNVPAVKTIKTMLDKARRTIHKRMKQPDFTIEQHAREQQWSSVTGDVVFQLPGQESVWRRDGNDAVSIAPTLRGWDGNLPSPNEKGVLQMMRQTNVSDDTSVIIVGRKSERPAE